MIPIDRTLRVTRRRVLWGLTCFVLLPTSIVIGQVTSANVEGIVEDSTGARIPEASVKLISSVTGAENRSNTNHDGVFVLPGVIPGPYTLEIERQGFATAQITGLTLNVGETKNILIRLKVGPVTETVQIDASGITINKVDASVSTIVDHAFVSNIPLNGRSFEDLITMTPGVLTQSPQAIENPNSARGGVSVNGQRIDMNGFIVDGISSNSGLPDFTSSRKFPSAGNFPSLTAMGTTLSIVSVDALQEFRVLGSTYSAEYGGGPGGQFSLLTRSGTNGIHGSLFDYARNSIADSLDWFSGFNAQNSGSQGLFNHGDVSFLPYHQNDFGGAVGAPIVLPKIYDGRNRAFLFLSIERTHVFQPTAFWMQFVPSNDWREAAAAPMQLILNDYPPASILGPGSPTLSPFLSTDSLPGNESVASVRLDKKISAGTSAFFRISDSPSNSQIRNLSALTTMHINHRSVTFGIDQQLSSTMSNDFRLGYAASSSHVVTSLGGYNLGFPWVPSDLATDLGVPSSITSSRAESYIRIPGIGESAIDVDNVSGALHQWNLRDTFSFEAARHFLRAGFDYRHVVSEVNPAPVSIEADFFSADSLLNNRASDIAVTRNEPAQPVFNEFSTFVQDDWKVSKSLTISPGLRWDLDPPPHGANSDDAYTLLGSVAIPASLQLAPRGTPLWHTSWFNFAPRIGMAWTVGNREGRDLVLRAGAGIFFGTGNAAGSEAFNALGFSATNYLESTPVPVAASQFAFSTAPSSPYTRSEVLAFPRHLQLPYTYQWNISLEKALGRSQSFTASWVGANGRRLVQERRSNVSAFNPDFGEVSWFPSGLSSSYGSLQLKFQRTISPGIQTLASYVWSHNIDFDSTDPLFPLTRGNSDLDVRNAVQAAVSWNERTTDGGGFRKNLLGRWGADGRLTARTAYPVNLLGSVFSDPSTGDRYYSGVDLIRGRPLYLYGRQYPGGRIFNGGPGSINPAFVLPQGLDPGNAPRNVVRGFGDFQVNVAIRREFNLHGPLNLQVRAEAFNVLNHPDLGYVDPHLTDMLFGQANLLLNQSFGSPGSLFEPGGPRSLQFSLRLHF